MVRRKESDKEFALLDDHAHSRLRPENLFGSRELHTQTLPGFRNSVFGLHESTWVPALWTMFREIIDNSLDELIKYQYGDTLKIEFDPDTLVTSVSDNGRGVPIREIDSLGKGPAASILLGNAKASRNFYDQGEGAGMNGVGASAVNYTAEWFEIEVDRDGTQDKDGAKKLTQRWEEAEKAGKVIHKTKGPHVIRGSKSRSGTTVRYCPSKEIYPKRTLPLDFVRDRIWDIAVVNPQIKVFFNGERFEPNSGRDAVISTYFADKKPSIAEISVDGFRGKFYIVPDFHEEEETSFAIVNNIPVFGGASFISAFRNLYTGTLVDEMTRRTKKEELTFTKDMVTTGTMIYGYVFMQTPRFDSQAKVRLVSDTASMVKNGYLESDILSMMRKNPEWVESLIARARAKNEAADLKKLKQEQKKLKRSRVARLDDASHRNRTDCILFVMEGDSAKGLLSDQRDDNHGILPLTGKVMNVREWTPLEVSRDKALGDLMGAIGLQIGVPAIRRRLRFGSIYIAADEDEDGKNITALLTNFFYKFWPELFREEPFIYRFCTPYLILTRGKEIKYIYAHDYKDYQANPDQYKGWSVLRAKGLASLNAQAWKHVLKQPVLIPLIEDDKLEETLSLLFDGGRENDRKLWLAGDRPIEIEGKN